MRHCFYSIIAAALLSALLVGCATDSVRVKYPPVRTQPSPIVVTNVVTIIVTNGWSQYYPVPHYEPAPMPYIKPWPGIEKTNGFYFGPGLVISNTPIIYLNALGTQPSPVEVTP